MALRVGTWWSSGSRSSLDRSELYPILRQLNRRLLKWVRHKYKRFRSWKRLLRRWEQVTAMAGLLRPLQWVTGFIS